MAKVSFSFKGLMAPVFTAFSADEKISLNLTTIDAYANFLKEKGITGVLVNGTTGEGPALNTLERKLVCQAWKKACDRYGLTLMVQIGGAPLCEVAELAQHAEQLRVDAILCLPELYFKPKTVQDLVAYLKRAAKHCPTIPFLYYHIPMFTGLNFHMPTFCDLAEREIPNFVGLKYTSGDLEAGAGCLKEGRSVFLGADTILSGALVLGFDSAIMTTLNICPELAQNVVRFIAENRLIEAKLAQDALTKSVKEILEDGGGEWVPSMKKAFNQKCLNAGPVRDLAF